MHLPVFIAKRYLFAKKSHNVINIISLISACGIAIGTLALVVILSVYNGFEGLIKSIYNSYEADLLIKPATGKTFIPDGQAFDYIRKSADVLYFCEVVEENIFIRYREDESIATIKGVDSNFANLTTIKKYLVDGEFSLHHGELEQAVVGKYIASNIGLNTHFIDPIYLYFPSRNSEFSLINPSSSLNQEKIFAAGVFSIEQSLDRKYIFVPILTARRLLEYQKEVTSIELYLKKDADIKKLESDFSAMLGNKYVIKDRYQQNETLYKMMKAEKLSIYLILLFILIIISCNVFGSLSMLIMEKRQDIITLRSIGAKEITIKRIFLYEGWMISVIGIAVGTILGLLVCFLQQKFGIVPMPGNFIVKAYPVVVQPVDIVITVMGVGLIGYLAAKLPLLIIKKLDNF